MEEGVFRRPAVAGVLEENYVEARLHMDAPERIEPAKFAVHLKVREERVAGTPAMPTWAVVDPASGTTVGTYQLAGGPGQWESGFLGFVRSALGNGRRRQ